MIIKKKLNRRRLFATLVCMYCAGVTPYSASGLEVNDGNSPERYFRFYPRENESDFIGAGFDWSGIAHPAGGGGWGWVTMITDTYYLSSRHACPSVGMQLTFYPGNDVNAQPYVATVDVELVVGIADVAIGRLTSPVPSWVRKYPLLKRQEATNYLPLVNREVFLVGAIHPDSTPDMQVGRNEISSRSAETLGWTYDIGQSGLGNDEAILENLDSGGPSFAVIGANLVLAGIHGGSAYPTSPSAYDSSISAIQSSILSVLAPTSEHPSVATDLIGDLNGDYRVNSADFDILESSYGAGPGFNYNQGDLNGDGQVTNADYALLSLHTGESLFAPSDFNQDAAVNKSDMFQVGVYWGQTVAPHTSGDANGDTIVDAKDIGALNSNWPFYHWTPPTPTPANHQRADLNWDSLITIDDVYTLLDCPEVSCGADINPTPTGFGDGVVDFLDINYIYSLFDALGPADINADGKVDNADLSVILHPHHWRQSTSNGKADGDVNGDGYVDIDDFTLMADWWGKGVSYSEDQPPLSIPIHGDFNYDGTVDAADYAVWRKTNGSAVIPGTGADANFDGQVDPLDYAIWRSHFGEVSPSSSGSSMIGGASVPEPSLLSGATLLAIALVSGGYRGWRHSRR